MGLERVTCKFSNFTNFMLKRVVLTISGTMNPNGLSNFHFNKGIEHAENRSYTNTRTYQHQGLAAVLA
jgi:hypothetical protein